MNESSPDTIGPDPVVKPNIVRRLYNWVLHWAETPYGTPALGLISFSESSFFPIPPDVLQIALSISKPKRSFFYALVSTGGSVLGAMLGWVIGFYLWESIDSYVLGVIPGLEQENFDKVKARFDDHAFLALFTSAFTPIPFKVFTIGAGMFSISLPTLVAASLVGRASRFFLVATFIFIFGKQVTYYLDRYFNLLTFLFTALLIGGLLVVKYVL